jgi:hypothetical protein
VRIAYLTDIEGQWKKLAEFADGNPLVTLDAREGLVVAPGAVFVFGGDAIDRGAESRRIVDTFLQAKRRQKSQVILLAGNRDLNKMRLRRELTTHPPARAPSDIARGPKPLLLRWIFANSMNAPRAFDLRRQELGKDASDDDVVASFLADVEPDGALSRYIASCQLAWRHGETLFVHGAVTDESLGHVPLSAPLDASDVDTWVDLLNSWCAAQVAAYRAGDVADDGTPAWSSLLAYQGPVRGTRLNQASVVYGRYTDDDGNPWAPSTRAIDHLARSGVRRVVAGHTPTGDTPAVLRARGFELVLADDSYSRLEIGTKVVIDGPRLVIEGRARLDDGTADVVRIDIALDDDVSPLALRDRDTMHLVKGRLDGGGHLLFKGLPQYAFEQRRASDDELAARPLGPPVRDDPSR